VTESRETLQAHALEPLLEFFAQRFLQDLPEDSAASRDAEWQVESWQGIAERLRGRETTTEELEKEMHGRPNAHVLSYLAGRPVRGQELAGLIEAKESLYRQLCLLNPRRFALSPGAQTHAHGLVQREASMAHARPPRFNVAVADAYGWSWPMTDDEVLTSLFALNQERMVKAVGKGRT
jgi:hypothetical protein